MKEKGENRVNVMRSFGKENNKSFFEGGASSTLLNKLNIQNKKIEKKPSYGRSGKIYTRNCLDEQYVTTNEYFNRENRYFEEFPKKWKRGKKRNYKEVISYYKRNENYLNSPHHSRETSFITSKINVDEYANELGKIYFPKNTNVEFIRERMENETRNATSVLINSGLRNICTEEYMGNLCKQQFVCNALLNLFNNIGKEAINLYGILKPSLTEVNMRKTIIKNIKDVCGCSYSKYHLVVFGSCNTDLDMYNSDIDVCIYTNRNVSEKREVNYLYGQLRSSPEFKSAHIKMICGASVPIIKCVFYNTGLSVDISFNRLSSIVSTIEIQKCLEENKLLHYIITFFKVLLIENNLNDASKGGLSSYRFFLILKQFLQNTSLVFTKEQPCLYIGEVIYKFTAFISTFKDKPGLVAFLQSRKGEPPLSPFFRCKERKIRDGGDGYNDGYGNGDSKESLPKFYVASDKTVQEMFLQLDVPVCESVPTGKIKFTKILDTRNCFKILFYRMIDWFSTNIKITNQEAYSEYKDLIFRENCETIAFLNILGENYLDENLKQLYKIGRLFLDVKKELKSPTGTDSDKEIEHTSDDEGESCNNRNKDHRRDLHKRRCGDATCINSRAKGTDLESKNTLDAENIKKRNYVKEYNTADIHSVVSKRSENIETDSDSAFQKKGDNTNANNFNQKCDSVRMCKSCHSAEQFDKKVSQLVLMLERHLNGGNSLSNNDTEQMKTPTKLNRVTSSVQNEKKGEELSDVKSGVKNKGMKRGRDAVSPTREEQWKYNKKNKMENHDPVFSSNSRSSSNSNNSSNSSCNSKNNSKSSNDKKNLKKIKLVNKYDCKKEKYKAKDNSEIVKDKDKLNFLSWLYSEGSINMSENINMGNESQDYFTLKMSRFNILYRIHKTTDNVSKLFCNRLHVLSDFFDVKHIIGERFNYYLQHKTPYENMEFRIYNGSEVEKIKQKTMSELATMKHYDIHTISEFKMNINFVI